MSAKDIAALKDIAGNLNDAQRYALKEWTSGGKMYEVVKRKTKIRDVEIDGKNVPMLTVTHILDNGQEIEFDVTIKAGKKAAGKRA
jgi:hypothetical protein